MANIPFNSEVDKITERELVATILERLSLGTNLSDGNNTLFSSGTLFTNMIIKILSMLPVPIFLNFLNVKIGYINIPKGSKSGNVTINSSTPLRGEILLAQSQQSGADVKDVLTVNSINELNVIISINNVDAYRNEENIKLYVI